MEDADNYGGNGGGGFFSLKNDKDTARVRFLYSGIEDVEGLAVHQVEVDGRKRWVNCLRSYNDPIDQCPFCAERKPQFAKLFVPVYDIDEDKVKIWERGKKFFAKMSSLCSHYQNLVSHIFLIERNGKKGDQATTYEIYEQGSDETVLEDLPEAPEMIGGFVLDKSAEDMYCYLDTGEFPPEEGEEEQPVRRRGTQQDEAPRRRAEPTRRTPATSRRRESF